MSTAGERTYTAKTSSFLCDREWERFISLKIILSFVPKEGIRSEPLECAKTASTARERTYTAQNLQYRL